MADEKKIVVVAGATGRLGRLIVKELLNRGYQVRAVIVKPFDPPEPPGLKQEGVELAEGDLTSVESFEKVMEGAHFAISAIGSKKPFSKKENEKIDNMGNQNLARAAKAKGLERIVVISSTGVGNSRDVVSFMYRVPMGMILKAKGKAEDFIRSCGADYTIIRPGGYTDKEVSGEIAFGEGGKFSGRVKREQIARVCVDAIANPAMKNRTFEVVDASTVAEERRPFIIKI
jgi:uncharacterized protein YbjT (DUF2867 family)